MFTGLTEYNEGAHSAYMMLPPRAGRWMSKLCQKSHPYFEWRFAGGYAPGKLYHRPADI